MAKGRRITEIEGLRALLAFWVFACHAILYAGYPSSLPGPAELLRAAWHAVDLFVIITGFSMWFALDHSKDRYWTYLGKRFFRLYPVFMLLFLVAIPIGYVEIAGAKLLGQPTASVESWFSNIWKHLALHAVMLHGVIPKASEPSGAPWAFLPPAWFVSYVWQFYLVAPLLFLLDKSRGRFIVLGLICTATVWFRHYLPEVGTGAFLPFHIEYLFIGACSYRIYKFFAEGGHRIPFPLSAAALVLVLLLFPEFKLLFMPDELFLKKNEWWLPLSLWALFFAMILDIHFGRRDVLTRVLERFFNSRFMQHAGRLSYSFYLVHALVMVVIRTGIAMRYPDIERLPLALWLAVLGFPVAYGISIGLFNGIERGGARLGKGLMAPSEDGLAVEASE